MKTFEEFMDKLLLRLMLQMVESSEASATSWSNMTGKKRVVYAVAQ